MNKRIPILATLALAFSLAAIPTARAAELPDPLPPPECPWLGGCDDGLGVPAPEPTPEPESCGLGEACLGVWP